MDLYRQIILEEHKHPKNKGHLPHADAQGGTSNPLCGDELTLELAFDGDGKVKDVAFSGQGCAVSVASASLMTEKMKGKSKEEVMALSKDDVFEALGGPVGPAREPCATLILKGRDEALKA